MLLIPSEWISKLLNVSVIGAGGTGYAFFIENSPRKPRDQSEVMSRG